ncbi:aspartyl protease family protein [Sphingomonas sp. CFBP 13706]|uniref:aspartyl protease family protein n=1 Tax=Sphingomonas sp. CFBP 13706 TaxID=2775314 RepID=UPI001FD10507|nr:aspartyl protease family protein [Sphingomonas sp. CFBP 13706]
MHRLFDYFDGRASHGKRGILLKTLLSAALLISVASGANAAPTSPVRLPLESYRKGVAARVKVAGRERLFQLDTAGGLTVISPALAKEIDCQPWGSITGFHMTGTKITAPRCDNVAIHWKNQTLQSPVAIVMDVGSPDTPIDGLLALDAFAGRTVTIDFAGRELTLETRESEAGRKANAVELPAHLAREIGGLALSVFIDVPTERGPARLELDSGNGGTILVAPKLLPLLGLKKVTGEGPQQGRFQIAPSVEASGMIFSPDIVIDGNLGMPFLKDWVVTMDLAQGRVWLKRSAVAAPAGMGTPPPVKPAG